MSQFPYLEDIVDLVSGSTYYEYSFEPGLVSDQACPQEESDLETRQLCLSGLAVDGCDHAADRGASMVTINQGVMATKSDLKSGRKRHDKGAVTAAGSESSQKLTTLVWLYIVVHRSFLGKSKL